MYLTVLSLSLFASPSLGVYALLVSGQEGKELKKAMISKRYKEFSLKKRGKSNRQLLRIIPMPSHPS